MEDSSIEASRDARGDHLIDRSFLQFSTSVHPRIPSFYRGVQRYRENLAIAVGTLNIGPTPSPISESRKSKFLHKSSLIPGANEQQVFQFENTMQQGRN
jgi:hypothetical protein